MKNPGKTFYKYLATYVLILIIPLAFLVYFFSYSVNILRNQYLINSRSTVSECKIYLDTHLSSLEQSINYFMNGDKVLLLSDSLHPLKEPESIIPILELQEELKRLELSDEFHEFVDAVCVNYFKSGLTIFSRDVLFSTDTNINISTLQNINMIDWRLYMKKRVYYRDYVESNYSLFDSQAGEALFYINTFPVRTSQPRGTIAVFLRSEKLISLLQESNPRGFSYILDNGGNIIASGGEGTVGDVNRFSGDYEGSFIESIGEGLYLTSFATSQYNGWKIISSVPHDELLAFVDSFRKNIILATVLCCLVGGLFSFLFARRISLPIAHISSLLNKFREDMNSDSIKGLVEIEHSLENLFTDNHSLQHRLDMQKQLLRQSFFRRLLEGTFTEEQEIRSYTDSLNWPFMEQPQTALILEIDSGGTEGDLRKTFDFYHLAVLYISNFLMNNWAGHSFVHLLESRQIVLILEEEDIHTVSFTERLEQVLGELEKEVNKIRKTGLWAGVGCTVDSLLEIYYSFDGARRALEWGGGKQERIRWIQDCGRGEIYFYPLHIEEKLMNSLIAGNDAQAGDILSDLQKENFQNRQLKDDSLGRLLKNMEYTVIKSLEGNHIGDGEEMRIGKRLHRIELNCRREIAFEELSELILELCRHFSSKKTDKAQGIISDITLFIDENFSDSQLTINVISKNFNLSEGYFSRLFKQNFKETFSSYLEKKRIAQSRNFLEHTEKNIEEIAFECGYNSSSVFRRAFKRIKGVSPHDYRDSFSP